MLAALLVLLAAAAGPAAAQERSSATRLISNGGATLLSALQDSSVSTIEIRDPTYVVEPLAEQFQLKRNVTLLGQGFEHTVFDEGFQRSKINLCPTCVWTFINISIANEQRGAGPSNDLFVSAPKGGRLVMVNAMMLRVACPSADDAEKGTRTTPRSAAFPNADGKQHITFWDLTIHGESYPHTVIGVDYAPDIPYPEFREGTSLVGGYAMHLVNSGRACRDFITDACLKIKSADACVNDMLQAAAAGHSSGGGGMAPGVLAVAIAVPLAVVLLGAMIGALWLRRRHAVAANALAHGQEPGKDWPGTADSAMEGPPASKASSGRSRGSKGGPSLLPQGLQQGWTITSTRTTSTIGDCDDDDVNDIDFGELLGCGSFGRVYKAMWRSREVAVKVIEHTTLTSEAVEREATLMLALNSPYVVRAFHWCSFARAPVTLPGVASAASAVTGGGSLRSSGDGTAGGVPSRGTPSRGGHSAASSADPELGGCGGGSGAAGGGLPSAIASRDSAHDSGGSSLAGGPAPLTKTETWIVEELCDVGSLAEVVAAWGPEPASSEAGGSGERYLVERLRLLLDSAMGLQELHQHNIVHGDLNARNVLVATSAMTKPFGYLAKLSDFGLSRVIRQQGTHHSTNTIGTISHCSPELLKNGKISRAADVYAFAIMMWEVYTCTPAFRKLHLGQVFETVAVHNLRPMIPSGMPQDYALLMTRCWSADPHDRPCVARLIACLKMMLAKRTQPEGAGAASADDLQHAADHCAEASAPSASCASAGGPGFGGFVRVTPSPHSTPMLPRAASLTAPTGRERAVSDSATAAGALGGAGAGGSSLPSSPGARAPCPRGYWARVHAAAAKARGSEGEEAPADDAARGQAAHEADPTSQLRHTHDFFI